MTNKKKNTIRKNTPKFEETFGTIKRVQDALKAGDEHYIFDDDLSWFNIHSDGWPPLPTINMILNMLLIGCLKNG